MSPRAAAVVLLLAVASTAPAGARPNSRPPAQTPVPVPPPATPTPPASPGIPMLVPAVVPLGFRVVLVRVDPQLRSYAVLYSNGRGAFAVGGGGGASQNYNDPSKLQRSFRPVGRPINSPTFRRVEFVALNSAGPKNGCLLTHPEDLIARTPTAATRYNVEACRAFTPDVFRLLVSTMHPVASVETSTPFFTDSQLRKFSDDQRARLRSVSAPLVVFSLPFGYSVGDVVTHAATWHDVPRYGDYTVRYESGRRHIDVNVTTGPWQPSDHLARDLSVPVHSGILGETRLVRRNDSSSECLQTKDPYLLLPLDLVAVQIEACGIPPPTVKRILESARLVTP